MQLSYSERKSLKRSGHRDGRKHESSRGGDVLGRSGLRNSRVSSEEGVI